MIYDYFPILIFMLLSIAMGLVPITLGSLIAPKNPSASKNSIYECGFKEFDDARMKFDIRFYLVAILFIIFDLEIAFLFPWAVVLNKIGFMGFLSMIIFLVLLLLGFLYEWARGALEWE